MKDNPLEQTCEIYLVEVEMQHGLHSHTLRARRADLRSLVAWARERGVTHPDEVTRTFLRGWIAHLHHEGYARTSMARMLSSVRSLLHHCERQGGFVDRTAFRVTAGRSGSRLPRVLTEPQAAVLLTDSLQAAPTRLARLLQLRDQAVLELLYGAGLRAAELVNLQIDELDLERREAIVDRKSVV